MKISFLFYVFVFPFTNSSDTVVHNRRTLRQPFFPFNSPVAPSSNLPFTPNPTTTVTLPADQPFFPKFPSSPPHPPADQLFFPKFASPPPPPFASFPANIPSPNHPNSPKSKSVSSKLIAVAVILVIIAAIVAAIVVYLRIQKRRSYAHDSTSFSDGKTHNIINRIPKLSRHSQSSSEFLYLRTLDNSHGELDATIVQDSKLRKLDSSELRPLPSLNSVDRGRNQINIRNNNFENGEYEEFYSVILTPDIGLSKDNVESSPSDQKVPPSASTPPMAPPTPPIRPPVLIKPENVETSKPKLKPLRWDKVRASSDRETVWDQLKSSSFKLNEEMIETLFTINTPNSSTTNCPIPPWSRATQEHRVLDPKKSQNIAILLRALHVTTEEVCDALLEGNADTLGTELLECLLKMAPSKEEEWKLKHYKDDSPVKLGRAERFLKAVLDVPFAFKRVNAMLYISNFELEVEYIKRSFQILEVACEELRHCRMFLKLLEAVLKTGNRMNIGTNRGDAHAFKLETLLKLVDVKGTDGKTTLLHFVVQEIIKSEGARLSTPEVTNDTNCRKLGLRVVVNISSELSNVKKAADIDSDVLHSDVMKLSKGISDISHVVRLNDTIPYPQRFSESINMFLKTAEEEIIRIQAQECVVFSLVKEVMEYFHGNSAKEEAHPFRIFMVVRDFLIVLDRVCKEVGSINDRIVIDSAHKFLVPVNPTIPPVFSGNRQYNSSYDERNSSSRSS